MAESKSCSRRRVSAEARYFRALASIRVISSATVTVLPLPGAPAHTGDSCGWPTRPPGPGARPEGSHGAGTGQRQGARAVDLPAGVYLPGQGHQQVNVGVGPEIAPSIRAIKVEALGTFAINSLEGALQVGHGLEDHRRQIGLIHNGSGTRIPLSGAWFAPTPASPFTNNFG